MRRWAAPQAGNRRMWWADYYVEPADSRDEREGWSENRRVAVQAAGMIALAKGGTTSALYWNPENEKGTDCARCLWTRPGGSGAVAKLPIFDLVSRFGKAFAPGSAYE